MAGEQLLSLKIEVPFPSQREAEIVYNCLRVDSLPKRSLVRRQLSQEGNKLLVHLTAPEARQLRVGANSLLEFLILSTETMNAFGPPVSEEYSHY